MAEDGDENAPRGSLFISTLMVMVLLLGSMFWVVMPAAAAPSYPTPISGTRTTYELNIEVDYFEGLLWPEVIDAFDFLVTYYEARNITTTVDFNSTNNVIEGNPYISDTEWRSIHRQYHDRPTTHIHFIIAKQAGGNWGLANPLLGGLMNVELTHENNATRHIVMHEVGHCIGIGLYDDGDVETYASSGFMASYPSNLQEYLPEDWNSSFAPDGAYGNSTWKSARIWNRFSVYRELYDDIADVTGVAIIEVGGNIYLREIGGTSEYVANIGQGGVFSFQPHPGNYTLEIYEGCRLTEPVFVNVTERAIIDLGSVTIEQIPETPPDPVEPVPDNRLLFMTIAVLIAVVSVLAFAWYMRRNGKEETILNRKTMVAAAVAAILLLLLVSFFWSQNDIYSAVTLNEFWDDMVDRNGDGEFNESDLPISWHSYGSGDKVLVRDRIDSVWYDPGSNQTIVSLHEYSGQYGEASPINVVLEGNCLGDYSEGEVVILRNYMVEYDAGIYPEFNAWTIVE